MNCQGKHSVFPSMQKSCSPDSSVFTLFYFISPKEFFGKERPRQLALNKSITAYQLRNLAHDTEYVISVYVLFGSVEGPGITTSARTCEYGQDIQVAVAHSPLVAASTLCISTKAFSLYLLHPAPIIFPLHQGPRGGGPLPCQPAVPGG